jgi:hypothetical protein
VLRTNPTQDNFSQEATTKLKRGLSAIREINSAVKLLSLNARIEAARAGEAGKGFAVVSEEMTRLNDDINATAAKLEDVISRTMSEMVEAGINAQGARLSDLAFNTIEILDRNLYERTADVRWWATESAFVDACMNCDNHEKLKVAMKRMDIILQNYTIYSDLVLTDLKGRIIANGRPDKYEISGRDVSATPWFRGAAATANGLEYFVQDLGHCDLTGEPAVLYSAAVREEGSTNGPVIGILTVIFDWKQAEYIVKHVRLSEREKNESRVLLFNSEGKVIATNDGTRILAENLSAISGIRRALNGEKGYSIETIYGKKTLVAYACTPGYETYRGLGWGCAILLPA